MFVSILTRRRDWEYLGTFHNGIWMLTAGRKEDRYSRPLRPEHFIEYQRIKARVFVVETGVRQTSKTRRGSKLHKPKCQPDSSRRGRWMSRSRDRSKGANNSKSKIVPINIRDEWCRTPFDCFSPAACTWPSRSLLRCQFYYRRRGAIPTSQGTHTLTDGIFHICLLTR